jgi:hypothetical protein
MDGRCQRIDIEVVFGAPTGLQWVTPSVLPGRVNLLM